MAKGQEVKGPVSGFVDTKVQGEATGEGEVCLCFVPLPLYQALSDSAQKKGLTTAQLIGRALDREVKKDESEDRNEGPRLLVED